jgi:1-propanol dehydrogenase
MQTFSCKTQIISGPGAVAALSEQNIGRLLMVTDPFFFQNGTAQHIAKGAAPEAVEYFHQVAPDPDVALAAQGTAVVQSFQPDTIVALGGGSAMDCAKAMAYFSGTKAKLVAIPTTSGSGSEVTDFAILTHGGVKHPLVDPRLCPDVAILDSDLLKDLPPSLIADGGFDVLTHALEAYTAKNAGAITDALAEKAFRTAFQLLPRSYAGHRDARPGVHEAATMAGMAFTQAGLGLCHAMAHSIGGELHIPHGRLNAILLPAVMSRNATAAGSRYAAIARAIGLEGRADTVGVRNLRTALIRLRRELGLPATLSQAGVPPTQVRQKADSIVKAALADPCCATNPVTVTEGMVRDILHEVTGNG